MWKQLHFEFTWPELTEKEIEIILLYPFVKPGNFALIDLVDGSVYSTGDLFKCKKTILDAQGFYTKHPEYLGESYINRYYQRKHFQLIFKPLNT